MTPIADPKFRQLRHEVVNLNDWEPDNEFPINPMGQKPKRIFICPSPAPHRFLIGGHRYLFKEPEGRSLLQIWSEVLAYEFGRAVGVPVPPAFLATAPRNGSPGVLIEFFYGYADRPPTRLIHGIERLQAYRFSTNHKRGSLKDNVEVCRFQKAYDSRFWWAQTLSFDAMIGNTDRHSENWGFLATPGDNDLVTYSMAPTYDNGTSFGYLLPESKLPKYTEPAGAQDYLARGKHHCGWVSGDGSSAQHVKLCQLFAERFRGVAGTMKRVASIHNDQIDELVSWCRAFDYSVPFTEDRAKFVAAQLRARRVALLAALS
jgi:hypothetical protein